MKFFKEIHGAESGETKEEIFRKIVKSKKLKPKEIVIIGDKETDIKVGKKIGCYTISINTKASWASEKDIIKAKPDFIINNLGSVRKVIEELNSL